MQRIDVFQGTGIGGGSWRKYSVYQYEQTEERLTGWRAVVDVEDVGSGRLQPQSNGRKHDCNI